MRWIVLLLCAFAPLAAHAREAHEGNAERWFAEWRFDKAEQALAAQLKNQPTDPTTLAAQGYERFLGGDFPGAVAYYKAAALANPRQAGYKEMATLAEDSAKVVKNHREQRSAHFIFRFAPEDQVLADYGLETLEAMRAALQQDLGYASTRPIVVDILRSAVDLAAMTGLSEDEIERTGTVAVSKWTRIMLTTPRAMRLGYEWRDSLAHEYVHYVVSAMTYERAPVWLQEGLAKFLDHRWRAPAGLSLNPSSQHYLAKALAAGKLITFEAMHPSMAKLPRAEDAALAFAEVTTAVACLHAKQGMPALASVLSEVRDGADARGAVARAFGGNGTWATFEKAWKSFMVGLRYKTLPGMEAPVPQYRKKGADQESPSEDEAVAGGGEAERFLRLGNMLILRDRPAAASVEYEKGAKIAGPSHWVHAVKLGRTYLALNRPADALRAVQGARDAYPELPWPSLIAGQALLAQDKPAEAIAPLLSSLGTNPFDPAVHCALAEAYGKVADADPHARARAEQDCRDMGKP